MVTEKFNHLFINDHGEGHKYTKKKQAIPSKQVPEVERFSHGQKIQHLLQEAWQKSKEINEQRTAISLPTKSGTYIEFESAPDFELSIKSLENHRKGKGIRLLNARTEVIDDKKINKATVFIPSGKESFYLKKVNDYIEKNTPKGSPKNEAFIASLNDVKIAVLESLWQGKKEWIPNENHEWCEIWLSTDAKDAEENFKELATKLQIELQTESLVFPERRVILGKVNKSKLQELMEASSDIAEFRRASETALFFIDMENREQTLWVEELRERLNINNATNVSICILDTGVNNGHILIQPVLADEDCHCYNNVWESYDHNGHGTGMAGLAIFGDIQSALERSDTISINHILESSKILPPTGENNPRLYGAITSQAISEMIIQNPERKRIICMAITAPKYEIQDGRPSSWSAAIDESISGYIDDQKKLFFVSAGNVKEIDEWQNYPVSNKTRTIQNPGQAWNAITVGAFTNKVNFDEERYYNTCPVAPEGGLSPFSTTSLLWDNKWPIKPEIVMEGGNVLKDIYGCWECEDLSILTTYHKPSERQFNHFNATSAATAQAAWMAAQIQAAYPDAWPETIRALLIHSSDWTPVMKEQFLNGTNKGNYKELLRICGYGVPNLNNALWCTRNNVNLIVQSELQPYEKNSDGSRYITKEMNFHELPWPKDLLLDLGEIPVKLKVTLSYFIEPSPGEIGWKDRYKYASCALRFDINGNDNKETFLARINAAAIKEETSYESDVENIKWTLGKNNRNIGSIHSDIWEDTAAQLATSNLIGVYPTIGWWRERAWLGRWNKKIRYTLIASLYTPEQEVDFYTPITTKIKTSIPINVTTKRIT